MLENFVPQSLVMQVHSGYELLIAGVLLIALGLILDYIRTEKWFRILTYVGIALVVIWAILLLIGHLPPL